MLAWLNLTSKTRGLNDASRRDRIRKLEKLRDDARAERQLQERGYSSASVEFGGVRQASGEMPRFG